MNWKKLQRLAMPNCNHWRTTGSGTVYPPDMSTRTTVALPYGIPSASGTLGRKTIAVFRATDVVCDIAEYTQGTAGQTGYIPAFNQGESMTIEKWTLHTRIVNNTSTNMWLKLYWCMPRRPIIATTNGTFAYQLTGPGGSTFGAGNNFYVVPATMPEAYCLNALGDQPGLTVSSMLYPGATPFASQNFVTDWWVMKTKKMFMRKGGGARSIKFHSGLMEIDLRQLYNGATTGACVPANRAYASWPKRDIYLMAEVWGEPSHSPYVDNAAIGATSGLSDTLGGILDYFNEQHVCWNYSTQKSNNFAYQAHVTYPTSQSVAPMITSNYPGVTSLPAASNTTFLANPSDFMDTQQQKSAGTWG